VQVIDGGDVFVFCLAEFSKFVKVPGLVDLGRHDRKLHAWSPTNDLRTTMSASGSTCS